MNVERNKNIDIIRFFALSHVIIYHIWVLSGGYETGIRTVDVFVKLGGEIGVTVFFILSGYGIYHSLNRVNEKNTISFFAFMKKRLARILPEYYISIIFMLFFIGGCTVYLGRDGFFDIICHFLLIHNLFPTFAGSINGVLWTMGDIFQFYLVAIPIFWGIKRKPFLTLMVSVIVTILSKFIILGRFLVFLNLPYQFWASRNIIFL